MSLLLGPTPVLKKRRRKRTKADECTSTTEQFHKLIKVQEESDKRMIELEEKN